ncbi:MAG: T9SS type A sorting domain-containing protein [Candidatus Zixiibacteriota bacterium]
MLQVAKRHLAMPIMLIVALVILPATISARSPVNLEPQTDKLTADSTTEPYVTIGVHDVGKIGLTISNKAQIGTGYMGQNILNPVNGLPAPNCEYPLGSGLQYLFAGAFWVGAIVGDDTLVSVGADGWEMVEEMWPDVWPDGEIIHRSIFGPDSEYAISEQDFIATYFDTLIDPAYVPIDPIDGPHIPLNIKVTQKSYAWSGPYAEDFVIFDYNIENIGTVPLEKVYMGILVDGDVRGDGSQMGFLDDICGFKKLVESQLGCGFMDTINLTWIADNDGKEDDAVCPFDNNSLTSVTGVSILRTPSDSAIISFNYWFSNYDKSLDWGPRQQGTISDPFRDFGPVAGQQLGTPTGDHNKYYIMSHPEIDYDQLFDAVDHTAEGWLPPAKTALSLDFADGYDTKYLLSVGPFDIGPGQTLPLAFAYVAGENFHTQCNAFDSLFNPADPQEYSDYLNFMDIGFNTVWAEWVYDNPGVDTDGDGNRGKYFLCGSDTMYYKGDGVPDFHQPDPLDIGDQPDNDLLPKDFVLHQNYPNPFNPSTRLTFSLNRETQVNLCIFNILGQKLATLIDESRSAGKYEVDWDGCNDAGQKMPSGVYFYRIQTERNVAARKMLLMK